MIKFVLTLATTIALSGLSYAVDPPSDKDNTGINKRDTSNQTLTPGDQSNAPEDLKITESIRQAVVKDDSLSMLAKNIKIITVSGAVTLRGPVKTEEEKNNIQKKATAVVSVDKITNQLEIDQSK